MPQECPNSSKTAFSPQFWHSRKGNCHPHWIFVVLLSPFLNGKGEKRIFKSLWIWALFSFCLKFSEF